MINLQNVSGGEGPGKFNVQIQIFKHVSSAAVGPCCSLQHAPSYFLPNDRSVSESLKSSHYQKFLYFVYYHTYEGGKYRDFQCIIIKTQIIKKHTCLENDETNLQCDKISPY